MSFVLSNRSSVLTAAPIDRPAEVHPELGGSLTSRLEPGLVLGLATAARENLSQRAYLRIRSSLIHSELKPGQRLVLRPLAAGLRLSPTPVREALLRLVSEQALTLDERGSAIVPIIQLEELHEIIDIRCDLEGRAAFRAARFATATDIDHIAAAADASRDARLAGDRTSMLSSNAEMHRLVCWAARAPLILRILEGIWMRIGPVYALQTGSFPPASLEGDLHPHNQLVAALRAGDCEAARSAAVAEVRQSLDWLEPLLKPTV